MHDAPATGGPARTALARLRAKLLDLTKRTSLLNWRTRRSAATTIVVVDEPPREVFRILVLEGKSMRFRPWPQAF